MTDHWTNLTHTEYDNVSVSFQGYVTEIMLTLEAAVDNLDLEVRSFDIMKEIFNSTPNLAKNQSSEASNKRLSVLGPRQDVPRHSRSTSYSVTGPSYIVKPCKYGPHFSLGD